MRDNVCVNDFDEAKARWNELAPKLRAAQDAYHSTGDTIMVEITCSQGTNGTVNIRAGLLDEEVFRKGYDILAASTLDLTEFSTTSMPSSSSGRSRSNQSLISVSFSR